MTATIYMIKVNTVTQGERDFGYPLVLTTDKLFSDQALAQQEADYLNAQNGNKKNFGKPVYFVDDVEVYDSVQYALLLSERAKVQAIQMREVADRRRAEFERADRAAREAERRT